MDDSDNVWHAWKFGMKRDDLFTTLHDRYNTLSYTLQDPVAFQHDVCEVSRMADTTEEFHRFMADRQRQRITELHESLESLAIEIIANPKLIGTDQWQHALQLFRTKSFDSLVRYFASYLPDDYLDRPGHGSVTSSMSSYSETDSIDTTSTKASSADDASSPFLDDFFPGRSIITDEPCPIDYTEYPLTPDSATTFAQSSDDASIYARTLSTGPPSRSMSFSGSVSSRVGAGFARRPSLDVYDDETVQSDACDTTGTSVCDSTETRFAFNCADKKINPEELSVHIVDVDDEEQEEEFPTAQFPEDDSCTFDTHDAFTAYDTLDCDTPTPRQGYDPARYSEYQSALPQALSSYHRAQHRRSPSPRSYLAHRAERGQSQEIRRSPEEALSKIQKTSDSLRKRPRGTRWQE